MSFVNSLSEASEEISKPEKAILLVGNAAVGKTSLARALASEVFDPFEAVTRGVETIEIPDFRGIKLLDWSASEAYENPIHDVLERCHAIAAMVLIDAKSEAASTNADYWCSHLHEFDTCDTMPKFIVITKCRGAEPEIDEIYLKKRYGITGIFKTDVKDRTGIDELRSGIRMAVFDPEEDSDHGEVAKVVQTMTDCLCRLVASNSRALEEIEWRDLERLLARAIEGIGFTVELTPLAKDGGKDLVATCFIEKKCLTYYIEIKHWKKGDRPGKRHVDAFLALNARKKTDGGLFLSSSGFTNEVYACIAEVSQKRVRLGAKEKIVSLCEQYVRQRDGMWQSRAPLPQLLFERTLK